MWLKVNNTVPWTYIIEKINGKRIFQTFCKKELQKTNQAESTIENVINEKREKLYVKWKGYDNYLNSWIDKKDIVIENNSPEPYALSKNKMKLQSDFSSYATKSNLKEATVIDTSEFAKKTDLTILKSNIDDLNINKLKAVPVDLRKLSNTVKSDDVK